MIWANDFTFFESVFLAIGGGMFGVLLFTYGYDLFRRLWRYLHPEKIHRIKFSSQKRFLVRIRQRIGLFGICMLTPIFLTVPIGTLLAHTIEKNRHKVLYFMLLSFSIWSLGLNSLYKFTGLDLNAWIKSFF